MSNKIGNLPDHWPYVPPEQQYEGFRATIESTDITVWEFERRMRTLVRAKLMSKARMYKLIKWFRKIKGISYKEYLSKRDKNPITNQHPQGLWW